MNILEAETNSGSMSVGDKTSVDTATTKEEAVRKSISPYDVFSQCIIRAENLISVHESTETIDEISEEHYCDCYRAAIVLTISALDAFIRKVVVSEIRRIISDDKKALTNELGDYLKKLLNQDKLLEAARRYNILDTVENAVKDDFATKSFQGEWKISSYLNMVGYRNIFAEVSVKADINENNLKRKLTLFTNRRHIIAHSGDYDLNQTPHKENVISKSYTKECVDIVKLFAKTIHEIMEDK